MDKAFIILYFVGYDTVASSYYLWRTACCREGCALSVIVAVVGRGPGWAGWLGEV